MLPNVTLTPAAAKFLKRIVRFSGLGASAGLRMLLTGAIIITVIALAGSGSQRS